MELVALNSTPKKDKGYYLLLKPQFYYIDGYYQIIEVGPFPTREMVVQSANYVQAAIIDSMQPNSEHNLLKTRLDKICTWPVNNHSEDCAEIEYFSVVQEDGMGNRTRYKLKL